MNTEQEKKPVDETFTDGRNAAGELAEGELEQVSGGARTAEASLAAPKRPCRETETN